MLKPFEEKSPLARALDRVAFKVLLLFACLGIGFFLYSRPLPSLLGGVALYTICLILLSLWERATLKKRESALRARVGAALALEELTLMEETQAHAACARYLSHIADLDKAQSVDAHGALCPLEGKLVLIRCDLRASGENTSAGAVLAAARARMSCHAARAVLCTTTHFDAHATQLAEELDPPVRLVDSAVLLSIAGRLSPATDEQLVALGKRRRSPFSWPRLKIHIFSPEKQRRYLLYAFALLLLYLLTTQLYYLFPSLLCYVLALLSHRAAQLPFRI